jgi:MFS family permease
MRSTMTHVMMLTVVPLMGYFLDWVPFPLNYQIIFLLAFIGAMVSTWHVKRIQVDAPTTKAEASKPLNVQEARRIVRDSPEFGALLLGTFIYQWAVSLASPLFNVYFVEHLGASESWIGWRTTLASIASIVAYRFWPRRVEQLGERRVLTLAAPMMALFPLLTGLSQSLTPNLLIILIPRLFGSAVMLSRYGILLRVCPDDRRPTYIAIYAILANIAAFIAPMVGVNLVDWIGIRGVFFVSAGFRLTAALLYHRLPKIPVRDKVPAQG